MRGKRIIALLIVITLVIVGTINIAEKSEGNIGYLYDSYTQYNQSKKYNNESYVEQQDKYKEKVKGLNEKHTKLDEETDKLREEQREIAAKVQGNSDTEYERLSAEKLYQLAVKSAKDNGTVVEKFYTFDEPDIYTIQIKGIFKDINNTFKEFNKEIKNNEISIGNISLRQDYDAYNLKRDFDGKSMLEWYNNKIVNAMGDVIDLSDLIEENNENKDVDVDYTLMTLDDVKLNTEAINREVTASNKRIDEEISELLIEYGKQKDIITKSEYEEEIKEELIETIDIKHETTKQNLIDKKEKEKADIEKKYNRIFEREKAKVADAIFKYNKKLVELKATLADSSHLDYTMTFTLKAR